MMPHRALVNLITFQKRNSSVSRPLRTLQFASLSFDVSFQEMFTTWCAGAALVLISEDARRDASELLRVMSGERVERTFLPFVALQQIAETASAGEMLPSSLREIITAGEQLKITPHVARLLRMIDGCILDNHYGPSETHLATMWRLDGDPGQWPPLPPIGKPIANAEVYLLDERLQPVPIGIAGELYIGGEGLARGYLRRPALTAEKFVPHPYTDRRGARLYRTGDRVRFRRDGHLEFLGRADDQVKIRGYRIEPGEIEAALKSCPSVREAAVIAGDDVVEGKRLIGYVVPDGQTYPATNELRDFLKERLPEHMIPAVFVFLERMPVTASGKPDRRALPAPDASRPSLTAPFVAPRNELEREIAAIWRESLRLERVGVEDNFFDIGGHSLLIIQVHGKLLDRLKREFSVVDLFRYPTVESLARYLGREQDKQDDGRNNRRRADARRESLKERAQSRNSRPLRERPERH